LAKHIQYLLDNPDQYDKYLGIKYYVCTTIVLKRK
jgi:hypothetical protein